MAFKILVTEIANEDLAGLVGFIARDNQMAAERFGLSLIGKLKLLQDHPRLGRIVPERGDPNLREIIHQPYRIVYRVREQESVIEVLRFWHGAWGEPDVQVDS
jgi:toxin ParE1/3/4